MQNFDPIYSPLSGVNLIEASAGTGKTYTISTLVVRLVLEQALSIKEILVVTFTEAATAELRERVLKRLQQAHQAVIAGTCDDPTLRDILINQAAPELSAERLKNALRGFDEAPIFTIHGFCQRMLQENAFESGAAFDTELITSQQDLVRLCCEDFWRTHFYGANPLFTAYVLAQGYSPRKLQQIVQNHLSQPLLQVIPDVQAALQNGLSETYRAAFQTVQETWGAVRDEISHILLNNVGLNRQKYNLKSIPQWLSSMDALTIGEVKPVLFDKFEQFTRDKIQASVKKDQTPPEHVFFDLCQNLFNAAQALQENYEQHLLALKFELFTNVRQDLQRHKAERHQQSFDDLLMNLYKALQGQGSAVLAQAIRQQYRAALIDEFQDTDPLQYAIFHTLFNATAAQKTVLFFIGDPKQAIYSFRGADIFTYLKASQDADQQYTLGKNYRSHPRLINAVNTLFEHLHKPFLLDKIAFYPVDAAKEDTSLDTAPLQLWHVSREQAEVDDTPSKKTKKYPNITKEWANKCIPEAVASEIVRLLQTEQVSAGDIAVLVRKNQQALWVQQALQARRVPSVVYSRESLFKSHEASEVLHLLAAVLEPANERALRTALATELLGMDGNSLEQLSHHEQRWEMWLLRFRDWHDIWHKQSFIRMFRQLLLSQNMPANLLSLPDGERRLTNLLHLGEVLQQASLQPRRNPLRLYKWLLEHTQNADDEDETYQLRLESDAAAVKLVTIHKSKGLEYPIVFLPFTWDGALRVQKAEEFSFHREDGARVLDLGSKDMAQHRELALLEERAENLRLLYVALTRAKSRCYLLWGAFKDAQTSALGHVLNQDDVMQRDDQSIQQGLRDLAAQAADDSIAVVPAPVPNQAIYTAAQADTPRLQARNFTGNLGRGWQLASFTALVAHEQGAEHQVDIRLQRQGTETTETVFAPSETLSEIAQQLDFISFPAGAQAGNLLHDILEHLDFQQADTEQVKTLIQNKLQQYGFALAWTETLAQALQDILQTPLDAQTGLSLAHIPLNARLNELEFYYSMQGLESRALYDLLLPAWQQRWAAFRPIKPPYFEALQGFMRGFIDLVFEHQGRFYLVDYKSNFLGQQQAAYHHSRLLDAMQQHHYLLQYHIYSLALHRYLQKRLPNYDYNQHFGGVYYLFLRGMKSEWGADYGVFRDKPDESLIDKLSAL